MSAREELLACPFCGVDEIYVYPPTCDKRTPYDPADRTFPVARCGECYAEIPGKDWDDSCKSAVKKWSTRAALKAAAAGGE